MAFRLFLLFAFVLLGRPQDLLPALQPLRPALALAGLTLAALVFSSERKNISAALATPEAKRYFLFVLIMIIGIPFAVHRRIAFEGIVFGGFILNVVFFFLLISLVTSLQRLKSLVWILCLCAVTYSIFGGLLQAQGVAGGRFNVAGSMFDPNDTAYVLVSLFPPCLYFVRSNDGLLKKVVAIAAVTSSIGVILLTGSRGGILGLGAVLLVLLLTKQGGVGKPLKFAIVLLLIATAFFFRESVDVDRYMTLGDLSEDYNVSSPAGRVELWKGAIALTFSNPLTGVGVECFTYAHFLDKAAAGESYLRYHAVHNSYLQISAELGLIGFAIFALMVVRSYSTFLKASKIHVPASTKEHSDLSDLKALGSFTLLGFIGLLICGMFLTQGYSVFLSLFFGLAASMRAIQAKSSALSPKASRPSISSVGAGRSKTPGDLDQVHLETRIPDTRSRPQRRPGLNPQE